LVFLVRESERPRDKLKPERSPQQETERDSAVQRDLEAEMEEAEIDKQSNTQQDRNQEQQEGGDPGTGAEVHCSRCEERQSPVGVTWGSSFLASLPCATQTSVMGDPHPLIPSFNVL
jgi:hypothetical protein